MSGQQKFYITTAISYPNGPPHIGHAYEAIATDAIARFERLDGKDVFFLTGTDEHGLKMKQTAAKEGLAPRALADRNSARFRAMAEALEPLQRRLHPHHRGAALPLVGGDLAAHGAGPQRRHLPEEVRRLVLRARRGLLRRERDHARARRRAPGAAGHAGRMVRGGDVLLPPLGLPGQAARALREAPRFHPAARAQERGGELRQGRAARTCRCRAPRSTGASRCRARPSTSCTCGSTR